ncbi:aminotransferase class I/II-fold pyridoxal phosphate-dependent enzyme [Comamonas aquatica]|nr:aminotransferase class I/II-fold pyridoxal phosphate-dependent enzyme [Comamonas aquatica]
MNTLSPTSWLQALPRQLAALDAQQLRRTRRTVAPQQGAHITVNGQPMLQFCSNDYLGLALHPALIEAARDAALQFGVGSGGSPMVSGHSTANAALEQELAQFLQLPCALYFYAGFATNASVIPALVGAGDGIFSDALNHASLIDGCRLSRASIQRYPHGDLAALEALLAASPCARKLVVSDAVFSMDGDVADIPGLLALCERHASARPPCRRARRACASPCRPRTRPRMWPPSWMPCRPWQIGGLSPRHNERQLLPLNSRRHTMPHMYVEYTNNLQGLNEAALMEALNATVCGHPTVSDEADVKTRIAQVSHYRIGLNSAGRAFAHVELRLMAGRTAEVKKELSDRIAAVLKSVIPAQAGLEVQLSVDIVDMDKPSYFKGKL